MSSLQEVMALHGDEYLRSKKLPFNTYKTLSAIKFCRTAALGGAEHVLQYLSRYAHRVAISDNRIIKVDNDSVVFKWRDYKDNSKEKVMPLRYSPP